MRVLDSHLHLWDPSRLDYPWLEGPLAARFAGAELAETDTAGAAVFVQAECLEAQFLDEVRWVAESAPATGVVGIVAGARLDRGAETEAHLVALAELALASGARIVGVRHLLQGEPDGTATSEAFLAGAASVAARGWAFDACVRPPQLPDVTALAAALPELRIVLDHLGKPAVGTAPVPLVPDAAWIRDIGDLAVHGNVAVKLSGLPAEAGGSWDATQVAPFLDVVADAFGPDRLLWGSDWPVSAVGPEGYRAGDRTAWLDAVAGWAEDRGLDVDAVLWRNAARVYGLA
ncbi:amidohydrolase family protein [Microbacterium sp. ASV81]|uniref:Amidohydrolase family protein n=1 Tax=Microbacterium capsulatum TaxID=3041921 RepID=A0ABU0XKS8_9MICO|nr:amidohydrolase family protein [Microbacterium sp. ASV81]MDQ4215746.1 amidohydrolase family protein [Microbacterium sp. ASV81]